MDAKKRLNNGLSNLEKVAAGDIIGLDERGFPLKAPLDGFLFFPKYPERDEEGRALGHLPMALFEIATPKG